MKIDVLLYDGFDELDAIAPFRVLQGAARNGASLSTRFVTLNAPVNVTGTHGLCVHVAEPIDQRADVLLVPGGGWVRREAQSAWAEVQRDVLPRRLAQWHETRAPGRAMASVCTGAMLLAKAGLLRGRNATTHHSAIGDLAEYGVQLRDARVVDDGDIITSGGVTSGVDLALWLVERYFGAHAAIALERSLEYERRGIVWRNE